MTEFNLELAKQLTQDAEANEFSVDFDLLWQWCGYSRKDNAKRMLKSRFFENMDYVESPLIETSEWKSEDNLSAQEKAIATSKMKIFVTTDCALAFLQLSKISTERTIYFIKELLEKENVYIHTVKPPRKEHDFAKLLKSVVSWKYDIVEQKQVKIKEYYFRIDFYIPKIKLAIEYDESHHENKENKEKDNLRQQLITEKLNCKFIRVSENKEYEGIEEICKIVFE